MEFRTKYTAKGGDFGFKCDGRSETKQSFKDECDVNVVLKRYAQTGVLPEMREATEAYYGDVSAAPEYQEALNTVLNAQEAFDALGSNVRERFENDPAKFLAFVGDPKNAQALIDMGLATPKPAPTPKGVPQKGDTGGAPTPSESPTK